MYFFRMFAFFGVVFFVEIGFPFLGNHVSAMAHMLQEPVFCKLLASTGNMGL